MEKHLPTFTRCGASWRVSWKCGSASLQVIQECFSTCSAVYRWWGSTWSIWDSRSWKVMKTTQDAEHLKSVYGIVGYLFPIDNLTMFIRHFTTEL